MKRQTIRSRETKPLELYASLTSGDEEIVLIKIAVKDGGTLAAALYQVLSTLNTQPKEPS